MAVVSGFLEGVATAGIAPPPGSPYNGADIDRVTPFNSSNAKDKGITLCRRLFIKDNIGVSHIQTDLFTPQIRVALGNVALWNMTEVKTCNWDTDQAVYEWNQNTVDDLKNNYVTPIGTLGSAQSKYVHMAKSPVYANDGATYSSGGKTVRGYRYVTKIPE